MGLTRRQLLKTLGALAGTAGASRLLSGCGSDEQEPAEITTWVFLMMENRSYDHYLGSRSLVEGLPGDGLVAGMSNLDRLGNQIAIWPANTAADPNSVCVIDPPHGWDSARVQFGGGACDGFVRAHQDKHNLDTAIEPMQYLLREHIAVTHALADAYTSCDRWFCSLMGPTLPNRMYWHAASSNGAKSNDEVLGGAFQGIPSIYHRLDAAGVDWAYYFNDVPVLGVLEDLDLEGRIKRFFFDFIDDAAAGRLPPVVYIDPGFGSNDDHPPHHPLLGQQLIAATYHALSTSPQWKNCQLVLTYDEHGGFFDHVPPPTVPDERAADGFDQLGFRVPTLIVGPWARPGYISSVQHDHTSCLKHLENLFGLAPLTMRSSAATDLSDGIDLERMALGAAAAAAPIQLPAVEIDESSLPDSCHGSSLKPAPRYRHSLVAWAEANSRRLGKWDRRHEIRDVTYGIADYLDKHGLGRIRRGR